MPGRRLINEEEARGLGYGRKDFALRRRILRETLDRFERREVGHYHELARQNLKRWRREAPDPEPQGKIEVVPHDWGEATAAMARRWGHCPAALNMANAYCPGGAYVEGTAAQEENMFRRTDCHFQVGSDEMDPTTDRYQPQMTALLSGQDGRVFLDTEQPRVCIRGPERRDADDFGYDWLDDDEVFPFFELRAAALDCRRQPFDETEARRRIVAQLDTLRDAKIRYAVLSAFGCGAFHNPADVVARAYREELDRRRDDFAAITFAVYYPGYGPDNYTPFAEVFADQA